ncbi:MAG: response regulator, partial [Planctomycetota bacterium]
MVKPHVLIVDDDEAIRALLFSILDRSGYRVTAAADGIEGLEAYRGDRPDVIIADVQMPRMDGIELAEAVLELEPDAVVLVLTGHGTVEDAVKLVRRGVYSVITKPCEVQEVLFMVEKALRDKRLKERSRDLEKRLEISERLAMIGKLAAGVAHELNNPLDGVIRFVKLTMESLPDGTDAREFQTEALRGLMRMSSIVKDLLTFSRNIALEVEEEGLETLLREAVRQTLDACPDKRVEVTYDLAVPDVSVPRGMYQVFQNLLKNAADAVDDGGRIELRAGVRDGEVFVSVTDD